MFLTVSIFYCGLQICILAIVLFVTCSSLACTFCGFSNVYANAVGKCLMSVNLSLVVKEEGLNTVVYSLNASCGVI